MDARFWSARPRKRVSEKKRMKLTVGRFYARGRNLRWPNSSDWSTAAEFQPQPSQPLVINGLLFEESNHPGAQIIRELPPPMSLGSGSVHEPVTFETSNTSSSSQTFEALKETSAIRCPHEDCQYRKATFKRRSDLNRHSRKHEGTTAFRCSAIGCRIRGIKASFIRPDKLREHIRRAHGHEAEFLCPCQGCCEGPFPLVLLGVHMDNCHSLNGKMLSVWSPLVNTHFCPLKPCRKQQKRNNMLICHVREEHSERDRLAQSSYMSAASLDPISCEVICPVCAERIGTMDDAFEHVLLNHMVDRNLFQAWLVALNDERDRRGLQGITCISSMFCFYRADDRDRLREMKVTTPELVANREAVLRLCPAFRYHPVFDDLKKK